MRWPMWRGKRKKEIEDEIRGHLQMAMRERVERGETPEEARAAAQREMGNAGVIAEITREMWGWASLERLTQDLRYGLRMLARSPGFTAVAVLTLALGIGANTAIFSLLDAVMLKTLPVRDPQQLVFLNRLSPGGTDDGFAYSAFQQFRDHSQSFAGMFAFDTTRLSASVNGHADLIWGQTVSGDFYSLLGVDAAAGQTFGAADDQPGAPPVAVISYDYWKRKFAMDPAVVGRQIVLKGISFTVVGVAPPGFRGIEPGDSPDIWFTTAYREALRLNDHVMVAVMARLKPGVSAQQGAAEITALDHQVASQMGSADLSADARREILAGRMVLVPGGKGMSGLRDELSEPLLILMVMVGLVLLIACGNVANLFLARAAGRGKEIAVRLALGAGRARLIRQLFTESILLALAGGAVGLLFATWAGDFLLRLISGGRSALPIDVHADARALAFTAGASLLTSVVFGLAPAWRSTDVDLTPALKIGAVGNGGARRGLALGNALVVSQIAVSVLLLVGAGLLVRSFEQLNRVKTGFHQESVLLVSIYPTLAGYQGQRELDLYSRMRERMSAIPGVRAASLSRFSLLQGGRWGRQVALAGREKGAGEQVNCNPVAPQFLETMGIPLLAGREFTDADNASAPKVTVVSAAFARKYFPEGNALGRQFDFEGPVGAARVEIIGVAGDVRSSSLREADRAPATYIPIAQAPAAFLGQVIVEVRTAGDPAEMAAAVRSAAQSIDGNLPLIKIETQTEHIAASLGDERSVTTLASLFGVLALVLACVGLYGVIAYSVAQRTREIGVRMALGAQRGDVLRLVLLGGTKMALAGVGLGLVAALGLTRLMASMLFEVSASDPVTYAGAAAVLTMVALAACWIPARRAMRVDPIVALRYE